MKLPGQQSGPGTLLTEEPADPVTAPKVKATTGHREIHTPSSPRVFWGTLCDQTSLGSAPDSESPHRPLFIDIQGPEKSCNEGICVTASNPRFLKDISPNCVFTHKMPVELVFHRAPLGKVRRGPRPGPFWPLASEFSPPQTFPRKPLKCEPGLSCFHVLPLPTLYEQSRVPSAGVRTMLRPTAMK